MVAAACATGPSTPPPAPPSNLLLITLDTVRADRLGAYGAAGAATPALDGMARAGVRFEQAIAAAPLTLPSHATILTGLPPTRHGLRHNGAGRLADPIDTLAERLRAAGYDTAAFVGAFVLDRRFGLDQGFALYDDEIPRGATAPHLEAERPASAVVERALGWLAEREGRPFFAWVHLYDPHAPYAPPEPFRSRFPAQPYEGEIAAVDAQVGRLLAEIESRGWSDRTLVAVAGDHGESLGEHGEATHGLLLYEATLRVPLLLRGAGLPAGGVVRAPVGLTDLGPTLAGLLGRDMAPPQGGRDLSADLRAGREPAPADLYSETEYPRSFGWAALAALRRGGWKLIAGPRPELYDLSLDPDEARDRSASGAAHRSGAGREPRGSARPPARPPHLPPRTPRPGPAWPAWAMSRRGPWKPGPRRCVIRRRWSPSSAPTRRRGPRSTPDGPARRRASSSRWWRKTPPTRCSGRSWRGPCARPATCRGRWSTAAASPPRRRGIRRPGTTSPSPCARPASSPRRSGR